MTASSRASPRRPGGPWLGSGPASYPGCSRVHSPVSIRRRSQLREPHMPHSLLESLRRIASKPAPPAASHLHFPTRHPLSYDGRLFLAKRVTFAYRAGPNCHTDRCAPVVVAEVPGSGSRSNAHNDDRSSALSIRAPASGRSEESRPRGLRRDRAGTRLPRGKQRHIPPPSAQPSLALVFSSDWSVSPYEARSRRRGWRGPQGCIWQTVWRSTFLATFQHPPDCLLAVVPR